MLLRQLTKLRLKNNCKRYKLNIKNKLIQCEGPSLLEIMIKPGARKDLGRPTSSTFDNKEKFMTFL